MALTSDDHSVEIAGTTVAVTGRTGLVHARWTLLVDGVALDSAQASGDFTLTGKLPDGSDVSALVHQSLLGPTEITVVHSGEEVASFGGFVA